MLKQLFCKHVYYFVADVQRTPAKYRNEEIKETKHYGGNNYGKENRGSTLEEYYDKIGL